MPSKNKIWAPNLFPKQFKVFDDNHRYLLVSGPRIAGKTWGILHKLVRHMWDVPGATVGMFCKTVKSATQFGTWDILHKKIIPEWIMANIGLEYTTRSSSGFPGPKTDNATRTQMFAIKNRYYDDLGEYGGISECKLYSCDCCEEVEEKTKSMVMTMVYFIELSNFEDRMVFTGTIPLLRASLPVTYEMHQWMADTNPSDEGEDSWIYDIFYRERTKEDHKDRKFQKNIGLIEMFMRDNPYVTEEQKREIAAVCHYDNALYDRYVNGLWTKGGMLERHFGSVFKPEIHVQGTCNGQDESEWEILLPTTECMELFTCWDAGDVNSAAQICERVTDQFGNLKYFAVLSEVVHIGEEIGIEDFTIEVMHEMDRMEEILGHPVSWKHYSDPDALQQWKSSIRGVTASQVRKVSNDRIILEGCPKDPNSVRMRVSILKKLLFQNKIYISANCFKTIEAIKELRKDKKEFVRRSGNKFKHPFDSLTYGLTMETLADLEYSHGPETGNIGLILSKS